MLALRFPMSANKSTTIKLYSYSYWIVNSISYNSFHQEDVFVTKEEFEKGVAVSGTKEQKRSELLKRVDSMTGAECRQVLVALKKRK